MKITALRPLILGVVTIGFPFISQGSVQAYSQAVPTSVSSSQLSEFDSQLLAQFPGGGPFSSSNSRFPGRSDDADWNDRDDWNDRREDFEDRSGRASGTLGDRDFPRSGDFPRNDNSSRGREFPFDRSSSERPSLPDSLNDRVSPESGRSFPFRKGS